MKDADPEDRCFGTCPAVTEECALIGDRKPVFLTPSYGEEKAKPAARSLNIKEVTLERWVEMDGQLSELLKKRASQIERETAGRNVTRLYQMLSSDLNTVMKDLYLREKPN